MSISPIKTSVNFAPSPFSQTLSHVPQVHYPYSQTSYHGQLLKVVFSIEIGKLHDMNLYC